MKTQQISTGSSKGNCYKYKNIMLDCGVPFTRLKNKSKDIDYLSDVKIIFISHLHSDHMYWTSKNGERNYLTAKRIHKEYPSIMWITGSQNVADVFEELGLRHMKLELNKSYDFGIAKLQLVKLYHDEDNYGLRVFDDLKGIYITDTEHIQGITFKDYDWIIIEWNHIVELHMKLAEQSEYPQRYLNAFNSHLNNEQCEQAIHENAKEGTEIRLVHLSSDKAYEDLGLNTHYKYKGER